MKNLRQKSFLHALAVGVYVSIIGYILYNGEKIFGDMNSALGPITLLMLLVLSVAIVGTLIFVKPIMLYLEKDKKTAVQFLGYEIGWLFIFIVIILLIQIAI